MEQQDNMAPGQQNYPKPGDEPKNKDAQAEDIIKGAQEEDQLDKLKETAAQAPADNEVGSPPDAYQYERKTTGEE